MRVAVTGATGYVGRFIVARLLAEGHEVRAWRRRTSEVGGMSSAIGWVEGGLAESRSHGPLLKDADALVHAAFEHVPGRYRGGEGNDVAGFLRINRQGSIELVAVADEMGVERLVFLSSRAVYGTRLPDRPLDEAHPARPDTHYGAYKLAVEQAVAERARGRAWASLRATGVYGLGHPLERSKWYDVVRRSLAGDTPPPRGGTEVAGEDVAAAVSLLLQVDASSSCARVFNLSDVYVTTRAVTRLAGGVLAPQARAPSGVMMTTRLQSLGWRPRGWPGVEHVVHDLARRCAA